MKNEILIIPDVHGRHFWRLPTFLGKYEHIVFLGDFFDPYPSEDISELTAMEEFAHILKFKQENPENVTLLIGNHDAHYLWDKGHGCRYSDEYAIVLHAIFNTYRDMFSLVYTYDTPDKKYLFSHAGVMPEWIDDNRLDINDFNELNNLLYNSDIGILKQVSSYRGGDDPYPSPIWADIYDFNNSKFIPGVYQIFGHSQSYEPSIMKDWACLDCHKPFVLNLETGAITEWTRNSEIK